MSDKTLTERNVLLIRARHVRMPASPECDWCHEAWPCDATRLADRVDELEEWQHRRMGYGSTEERVVMRARIDELEAGLREIGGNADYAETDPITRLVNRQHIARSLLPTEQQEEEDDDPNEGLYLQHSDIDAASGAGETHGP